MLQWSLVRASVEVDLDKNGDGRQVFKFLNIMFILAHKV